MQKGTSATLFILAARWVSRLPRCGSPEDRSSCVPRTSALVARTLFCCVRRDCGVENREKDISGLHKSYRGLPHGKLTWRPRRWPGTSGWARRAATARRRECRPRCRSTTSGSAEYPGTARHWDRLEESEGGRRVCESLGEKGVSQPGLHNTHRWDGRWA